MKHYKNKRVMLRNGGKFRKAIPADMGIGGVCPVCRHLLLQHYDGENTQHPDPRLFRYRCFTCEPLTEAEKKASDEKFAYQPSKFSIEDFFKVGEFSKTETPPNTKCIMCNEEIEDGNMSSALSLGSFPPATIKEVPVHKACPNYNGWKFYGGLTKHTAD